jgi:hypothetical protein
MYMVALQMNLLHRGYWEMLQRMNLPSNRIYTLSGRMMNDRKRRPYPCTNPSSFLHCFYLLLLIPSLSLQEIDLSTEAYLMYDPTRENAWCEAVMQGLGNRAQKYTKVDIG